MSRARRGAVAAGAAAAALGVVGAGLKAATRRAAWSPSEVPEPLEFPQGFRFGATTSAHQVEGGTEGNSWTRWERHGRPDGRPGVLTGERCGRAIDHWNRFEDDVDLMVALGIDAYRFSLEWSRLEPREGHFDHGALDRYRSWCTTLREAGIAPVITLHHFTEPLWLTDRGGFERPGAVDAFERFVGHVAPALGDVCDWWVTINEPQTVAEHGWLTGTFPPGKADAGLAGRVLEHLLLAHARAYHTLHRLDTADADGDGSPCRVSLAARLTPYHPRRRWNPADVAAAWALHVTWNTGPLDACTNGRFRFGLAGGRRTARHPELAGTLDYVGVNAAPRALASLDPRTPGRCATSVDPSAETDDLGRDLRPDALGEALRCAAGYDRPLLVTGHGICDGERPDRRRRAFLLDSLHVLDACIREGADVAGYLHTTLFDGFEWEHGFRPRCGLYRVDDALERSLTSAGDRYRGIIAEHRARTGPPPPG